MTTARERWVFRIEALPGEVPAVNRVRSALKVLLRRFGLRCTAILDSEPAVGELAESESVEVAQ